MKKPWIVFGIVLALMMSSAFTCYGASTGTASQGQTEVGTAVPAGANLAEHIDIILNETQLTVVNPLEMGSTGFPGYWTFRLIHDTLVGRARAGEYIPQLATEWHTDDYITFTFKLRDDVYFHNGDHFTADDVVWTYELVKSNPKAPQYNTLRRVDTIKAIDPYTVEITLTEMYIEFLESISRYTVGILNKNAYEKNHEDPSWAWIGTGPFKVVDFAQNDFCTLERFDEFWGDKPPTRSITYWTIPEMSTRMVMLQNKEAQVSFQMTPEDLDLIADNPDFEIFSVRINEPVTIGFNNQGDAIMKDVNFRLAMAYALNYEDIATVALGRWASASWDGNFWGPDTEFRLEGMPVRSQNIELAKEYLAKSVYKGEEIELLTTSPQNIRAAEIIQLQLEAVGIKIRVEMLDAAGLSSRLIYDPASKVQLHIFPTGMNQSGSGPLSGMTSRTVNRLNYNDPYINEMYAEYSSAMDPKRREEISHELQKYLYDKVPVIVAFWRTVPVTAVKGIGGIRLSSDQVWHDLRGIYWNLNETPEPLRP